VLLNLKLVIIDDFNYTYHQRLPFNTERI